VGGPRRSGDEISVDTCPVETRGRFVPCGASLDQFRFYGRVRLAPPTADDTCGRENLQAVTNRRDRFLGLGKVADDV
jgi:hypothetical protein